MRLKWLHFKDEKKAQIGWVGQNTTTASYFTGVFFQFFRLVRGGIEVTGKGRLEFQMFT